MSEEILSQGFDCAWVLTGKNSDFQNTVTALLDWKLSGQVTRVIQEDFKKETVVPCMGRLSIPFIVVDPSSEPDWAYIKEKCEGLQWTRLLLVLEKGPKPHAPKSYFEKVVISAP